MEINTMLDEFLISKPDGYKKDIQIFFNALASKKLPLIKEVIQGIRTENIIESFSYYKEHNNLASVSTAKRYAAAISEFFKYIIGNKFIENKEFFEELTLPTTIERSYLYKINKYISGDKDLKDRGTFEIYEEDEVRELIHDCDEFINNLESDIDRGDYNKLISALCIKLIAFNGITYREIRKIRITDDINKYNKLMINNFRITLPEKLSQQLKLYLKVREGILKDNNKDNNKDCDCLFITFDGDSLPANTVISGFLGTCTGRTDLSGIIKYAIRNMIVVGVNDSVIQRLTGAKEIMIQQASYNQNSDDEVYWNRYLDSRMRNLDLFDLL